MTRQPKQIQTLTNGVEVETTVEGWNPLACEEQLILVESYTPGNSPHLGISFGYLHALMEKVPTFKKGDFELKNRDGTVLGTRPVVNASDIFEDMKRIHAEHYGFHIEDLRGIGRPSSKVELEAIRQAVSQLDPETMDMIRQSNPTLPSKLTF